LVLTFFLHSLYLYERLVKVGTNKKAIRKAIVPKENIFIISMAAFGKYIMLY